MRTVGAVVLVLATIFGVLTWYAELERYHRDVRTDEANRAIAQAVKYPYRKPTDIEFPPLYRSKSFVLTLGGAFVGGAIGFVMLLLGGNRGHH